MSEKYLEIQNDREGFLKKVEENVRNYEYTNFPPQIVIETTAYCNMACSHCGHKNMKRKKGEMDIKLYKKIIDEIASENPETELWMTFYGDALLLRYKLHYLIKYAKDKGLKYLVLNTNGILLDDEMTDLLIEAGLDRFIFSLDGFTKETFEKIRVGGKRDAIYDNIIALIKKIEDRKLKRPLIEIQYSVMDENENELDDFIKFWSEYDVYIKVREKLTWNGTVSADNLDKNQDRIPCPWMNSVFACFWNGEVAGCVLDYEGKLVVGNVNNSSIKEIWTGKQRAEFKNLHFDKKFNELPEHCKNCMDWQAVGAESWYSKTKQKIDWKKLVLGDKNESK